MTERILLSPPDTGPAEEEAVLRALRGGWVAPLGPEVDAFEDEMAQYTGRSHAVALSSGTAALHLALLNYGAGPGDVVLTATMTFAATANAVTYTGAEPIFIDCDETGNIDVELLGYAADELVRQGRRIAAIVPVDLLGKVADYEGVQAVATRVGAPVIADSAESLGAIRNGRPAGNFGDAAILSFNGNKIMTTSGGGMLLTDDSKVAANTRHLATQARQPVTHYQHNEIGYNYRLSNILAAIGRAQLARLDKMLARRRQIRNYYRALFEHVHGITVFGGDDGSGTNNSVTRDNFWLTSILIDHQAVEWTTQDLLAHLDADGIEARPLWKPMHLQPAFENAQSWITGNAEHLFHTGISLPSGSTLSDAQLDHISRSLAKFVEEGSL